MKKLLNWTTFRWLTGGWVILLILAILMKSRALIFMADFIFLGTMLVMAILTLLHFFSKKSKNKKSNE